MVSLNKVGYTVFDACCALGISRSGYYASLRPKAARMMVPDIHKLVLIEKIKELKTRHLFWGYRRVWAWLRHREGIVVNQKKVRRLMKEHKLMATQTVHKAKRISTRSKPHANRPKQFWGIDMTKFMINALGWVYLVIVLDWYTKKIVGWHISLRSKTLDWKQAMDRAIDREFPEGIRDAGVKLISDNGTQPTSVSFMRDMATLDIKQIFTSYNNPKGNADTERVVRTIKEEVIWLNEFETLEEAKATIGQWVENDYNKLYVHSTLGYMSPEEFEVSYNRRALMMTA